MRPLLLVAALLFSSKALAVPALELEATGGMHGGACCGPSPLLGGRVGIDLWDILTFSVKGMSLSRFEARTQEVGFLLDVRVHNRGRVQFNSGLSLGVAVATFADSGSGVDTAFNVVRPFPLADIGLRVNIWKFFVGVNVGGWPFTPTWFGTLSAGVSLFGD